MALLKLAIFLLIFCLKTVYSILDYTPVVSTFLKISERIFFFYLWSLLLVCCIVRNVGSFCFGVTRWCVFLTFLPIYIPGWITSRLLYAVCSKVPVMGDSGLTNASNGSVLPVLRLIVLSLPVIGSMFASAECRVLYLLNIPTSTVRAVKDKVIAVKTEVYAMLDQVDQISITKIILGCLSTQGTSATGRIQTGRNATPTDDVQILSVESSTNANETSGLRPFKRLLLVVPFGKDILKFTETVLGFPSGCVTRCEDAVRNTVKTIEVIHGFPQEVISSINDLNDRFDEMESDRAKQPSRFGQLKDDVAKHCNQISQVQRDFACRLEKQDKYHQQSLEKLRLDFIKLRMMTKSNISKILCKVDEVTKKVEMVAKPEAIAEQPSRNKVTLPNPEASSTAEVAPHSELQGNTAVRQVNSTSSLP